MDVSGLYILLKRMLANSVPINILIEGNHLDANYLSCSHRCDPRLRIQSESAMTVEYYRSGFTAQVIIPDVVTVEKHRDVVVAINTPTIQMILI